MPHTETLSPQLPMVAEREAEIQRPRSPISGAFSPQRGAPWAGARGTQASTSEQSPVRGQSKGSPKIPGLWERAPGAAGGPRA